MNRSPLLLAVAAVAAVALAGCGASRSTFAMDPKAPAAFDPAQSDPAAVAVVDKAMTALGGETAWGKAKELRWKETIWLDGKAIVEVEHAWDRWNGRHRMEKKHESGNRTIAMYDLYGDSGAAFLEQDGIETRMSAEESRKVVDDARKRWAEDAYYVSLPFRLKDPGVSLKLEGERAPADGAVPKWDVVKVSFPAGGGPRPGDVYYVLVDKTTHVIDSIEVEREGGRIGYRIEEWREVSGLKLPGKLQNIGYASEKIEFTDLDIDDSPDDELYVPTVGFD